MQITGSSHQYSLFLHSHCYCDFSFSPSIPSLRHASPRDRLLLLSSYVIVQFPAFLTLSLMDVLRAWLSVCVKGKSMIVTGDFELGFCKQ
ncbi:hypothetical protein K1719_009679 [Acacia pycnantha]|nr:hypothetical protein K1719_009679 [Acacia pycnantha]